MRYFLAGLLVCLITLGSFHRAYSDDKGGVSVTVQDVQDKLDDSSTFLPPHMETTLHLGIKNDGIGDLEFSILDAAFLADNRPKCRTICYLQEQYTCIYNEFGKNEITTPIKTAVRKLTIAAGKSGVLPLDTANCGFGSLKSGVKRSVLLKFVRNQPREVYGPFTLDVPPTGNR